MHPTSSCCFLGPFFRLPADLSLWRNGGSIDRFGVHVTVQAGAECNRELRQVQ